MLGKAVGPPLLDRTAFADLSAEQQDSGVLGSLGSVSPTSALFSGRPGPLPVLLRTSVTELQTLFCLAAQ